MEEEDNDDLMAEISEGELLETLHTFQKDKNPGPDGWPIELYLGLFDIIGADLLKVMEESRREGFIHATLNSTFIALIPKADNLSKMDYFRPISLCNYLYKIISKGIAKRLKDILS